MTESHVLFKHRNYFSESTPSEKERIRCSCNPHYVLNGTLAVRIPDNVELFKQAMRAFKEYVQFPKSRTASIAIEVGVSKVHPSDMFCRKKGREVALSKLQPVEAKLYRINVGDNGYVRFYFAFKGFDYGDVYGNSLIIETHPENGRVRSYIS